MATIGIVNKTAQGFRGKLQTLMMKASITIIPNEDKTAEGQPDFRVLANGGFELGAAWVRRNRDAEEYISLSLAAPEFGGRIRVFDDEFVTSARQDEAARRLATVPGIGPVNATALVAAVGDASAFGRARDLAAWLGLVPKQATTGGKPRLLGITKRGSRYLRKNLIHGARAVMPRLAATHTRLGQWLRDLLARAHKNTVAVALANKLARIAWAVLARGRTYEAAVAPS